VKVFIVGANGGLGQALSETYAQRGWDLILQGRHQEDLAAMASDLQYRFDIQVSVLCQDLLSPGGIDNILQALVSQPLDAVIFAQVITAVKDGAALPLAQAKELFAINFWFVVELLQGLNQQLLESGASVVTFSSIACIRPRSSNLFYTGSKMALEAYVSSMQHQYNNSKLKWQHYRLGYLHSRNSFALRTALPIAKSQQVAQHVYDNMDTARVFETYPQWWSILGWVLNMLPWSIFKRLNF